MYDVLVTCRALDGGKISEVSVAIIVASTASVRQRVQRLGRARPAPGSRRSGNDSLFRTEERRLVEEAVKVEELSAVHWRHRVKQ